MQSLAYHFKRLADTEESIGPPITVLPVKNPSLAISFTLPRSNHLEF